MAKKEDSSYQISLDIPVQLLRDQDDSHLGSSQEAQSSEVSHLEAEQTIGSTHDAGLLGAARTIARHGTQISLLDELSDAQFESVPSVEKIVTPSSHRSSPKACLSNVPLSQVQIAIATPAEPTISEPYLLPVGAIISSPGGHFSYRILGACCRLFDRNELPWPCCRIQWRSKEPSWRRIGKRFVPDLATKRFPSYMVEILDHEYSREPFVLTLYWLQFPSDIQDWWYTKYVPPSARK